MKTITVTLGGNSYEIAQLPAGASRQWRQKFGAPLEQLIGAVQASAGALKSAISGSASIDAGELIGVLGQSLLSGVGSALLGSMDTAWEMLYAYSPTLKANQSEIEAAAFDDEGMRALVEVLKLAFPFGELLRIVNPGQPATPTKKS
jgi:hypothetical protein